MHKKLLLLIVLLCGDCLLLGMNENKEEGNQLCLGEFYSDLTNNIINKLSMQALGRLSCTNKFWKQQINDLIDGIVITGTLPSKYDKLAMLKENSIVRKSARCGCADYLYGKKKSDYTERDQRIFTIFKEFGVYLIDDYSWDDKVILYAGHPDKMSIYHQLMYKYEQQENQMNSILLYAGSGYHNKISSSEYERQIINYKHYKCSIEQGEFALAENILRKNIFTRLKSEDIDFQDFLVKDRENLMLIFLPSLTYSKVDKNGYTALYAAYVSGYSQLVELLLVKKVPVGARTLFAVCENKDVNMMKMFLKYGVNLASINKKNEGSFTALYAAYKSGSFKLVKLLLNNHVPMDTETLSLACNKRDVEAIKLFLECGVDVHSQVNTYWFYGTLLECMYQCPEIYKDVLRTHVSLYARYKKQIIGSAIGVAVIVPIIYYLYHNK
jgi:hypothetical protein